MGDAGFVPLLVRMVVSLVVVLAIVAVAYLVARRRAGSTRAVRPTSARRTTRRRPAPAGVEVVGRVGISRGSAAVAIRFGDRVVLVAAGEQGPPTTLSEMSAAEWDDLHAVREPIEELVGRPAHEPAAPRQSFIDALRQATVRHA